MTVRQDSVFLGEDFEVGPGPKFHVYLVPKAPIRASGDLAGQMFVDLGRLRAFKGSQRYADSRGRRSREVPERHHLVRAVLGADLARGPVVPAKRASAQSRDQGWLSSGWVPMVADATLQG